jgi:serine O-acetyltransferase
MLRKILTDLRHKASWYELPSNAKSVARMCLSDGTSAQLIYRAMQYFQRANVAPAKVIAFGLYRLNAVVGHVVIGRDAEFGDGLIILHSFGIVVNSSVKAGKNLVLEHGVTIGAEKNQSPVIGDNVFIGAGAKVIGGIRIGNDVKIGANAVVTKDVPDGATVVGIPGRVVKIYGERVDRPRDIGKKAVG